LSAQPNSRRILSAAALFLTLSLPCPGAGGQAASARPVRTGIDVLESTGLGGDASHPKRIGVLTNQSGIDSQGRRTIDALVAMPGVKLAAIFSPEHGLAGKLDTTEITEERDAATGVPVYSVYGDTDARRRPPLEVLKTLDAVVIDLQDVGARYYTYKTTVGYFLEGAAQAGIEVIVLDRPNPIGGSVVEGTVSDEGRESFILYHPLPTRHGMTLGELALLFNSERKIHARLRVVAMEGWRRRQWYDQTGLPWVNPSTALRSLTAATLYAGVALIEFNNVSVGRGTDTPFELVGAPWIRAQQFADYLNRRRIPGVRFTPAQFTPRASVYAKELCRGIRIELTDRDALDPPELGVELASALSRLYPREHKMERMILLLGNQSAFQAIQRGDDPRRIARSWQGSLKKFKRQRQRYLLYR
jgi:uncharacterized protein YbbC (DUF1343 family)